VQQRFQPPLGYHLQQQQLEQQQHLQLRHRRIISDPFAEGKNSQPIFHITN